MENNENYFNQKNLNDNLIYKYAKNKLVTLLLKDQISRFSPCSKYDGIYYIQGEIEEYKDGFILFKKRAGNFLSNNKEYRFIININNIISIDINYYDHYNNY